MQDLLDGSSSIAGKDTAMRKIGLVLVVLALAVGFGVPAEAGGKGALTAKLMVGETYTVVIEGVEYTRVRPTPYRIVIGSVSFKPNKTGGVDVSVKVRDKVAADMTFEVHLVPSTNNLLWPGDIGDLKTDGKGMGSFVATAYPDDVLVGDGKDVPIKISMYNDTDGFYYATDLLRIDVKTND
jgi:hypothetical protein